jgi:hypothetical protein
LQTAQTKKRRRNGRKQVEFFNIPEKSSRKSFFYSFRLRVSVLLLVLKMSQSRLKEEPKPPLGAPEYSGTSEQNDSPVNLSDAASSKEENISNEKRELKESDCYEALGYCWPRWKKWGYLASVAFVQVSMNFNTSVYPNAIIPLSKAFNISEQHARTGQMAYLVTYSIGCELWAPWSEELGRWPILQLSMFLINIWQILAGLAPNWGSHVVARALVGFPRLEYCTQRD